MTYDDIAEQLDWQMQDLRGLFYTEFYPGIDYSDDPYEDDFESWVVEHGEQILSGEI